MVSRGAATNVRDDQHPQGERRACNWERPFSLAARDRSCDANQNRFRKRRDERERISEEPVRQGRRRVKLAKRAHAREEMKGASVRVCVPRHPGERTRGAHEREWVPMPQKYGSAKRSRRPRLVPRE